MGVKIAGIEDEKGGDIEAISCRWSTSLDYRRMFVCFFKNGRILLRMCREKIRILDGGGNLIFCALSSEAIARRMRKMNGK